MVCKNCGKELGESTKLCDGCGTTVDNAVATPKKKKSKLAIIILAVIAVVFIGLVALLGSDGEETALTVSAENNQGATFNMSFDDFNNRLNQSFDDTGEYLGQGENQFEMDSYWSNMVEPMVGSEDGSGVEYTMYSAVVNSVMITANIQDGKLASAKSNFAYDEYEMGDYFGTQIAMACGGLDVEEAAEIIDTIANGVSDNTMIYKDGVLYSLISVDNSNVAWNISAASNDFVSSLEASGSCNVLRW